MVKIRNPASDPRGVFYCPRGAFALEENMTTTHEWQKAEHALAYLARADDVPHRTEGEGELLRQVPADVRRILDLGTGDGRVLSLLKIERPGVEAVAADFSPVMLEGARKRFAGDARVRVVEHDMRRALPAAGGAWGSFDAVVSSFAIHHLPDERKRSLYGEIFSLLTPGGIFANLEHVASVSVRKHHEFLAQIGCKPEEEDRTNLLSPVGTQLAWLREIGFEEVDCDWKWLELALFTGKKPLQSRGGSEQ
jgi:SAM-dependent methyltransferase